MTTRNIPPTEADANRLSASESSRASTSKQWSAAMAATLVIIGLVLVGTGPSEFGPALTLGGLVWLMFAIHTFGRLGEGR